MGNPKHSGFTLVELMFAIAVLAILLAVAMPSFRTIIENNRRTTTVNSLLSALQLARAESVKRSETVSICPSSNGTSCAGNTDWSVGWIVFSDLDADGAVDSGNCATGNDCLLRVNAQVEDGISVAGSATALTYLPSGLTNAAAIVNFDVSIDDCTDATSMRARQIAISVTGRPNVTEEACS